MAADVAGELGARNSCYGVVWAFFDHLCLCFYFILFFLNNFDKLNGVVWQWKEKYAHLENKRNALRHVVNILQPQIDRFQAKNAKLRKG